jgi:hypothetical protein
LGLVFNGDDHHVSRDSYGRYGSSLRELYRKGPGRRRTASDE